MKKRFSKRDVSSTGFLIDGEDVSEEEYNAQFEASGGNRIQYAGYDTGTMVSEESIRLLLANDPACYHGEGGPL